MALADLSERELDTFIRNYEANAKTEGGKFTLADVRLERQRRVKSPFDPRETAKQIVCLARESSDGLVTYKEIWERFRPGRTWTGNAPRAEMAKALAAVIAYCVDQDLPLLTTLVVLAGSRRHSEEAVFNIYEEAKALGVITGADPHAFVSAQQELARKLPQDRFDADQ